MRPDREKKYRPGRRTLSGVDLETFALKYMPPVMDLAQQTIVYR
jgi:hypothetical protein